MYSVEALNPNSGNRLLPRIVMPVARNCVTKGLSFLAARAVNASVPWFVGSPATSTLSFTYVGTPASHPSAWLSASATALTYRDDGRR